MHYYTYIISSIVFLLSTLRRIPLMMHSFVRPSVSHLKLSFLKKTRHNVILQTHWRFGDVFAQGETRQIQFYCSENKYLCTMHNSEQVQKQTIPLQCCRLVYANTFECFGDINSSLVTVRTATSTNLASACEFISTLSHWTFIELIQSSIIMNVMRDLNTVQTKHSFRHG